MNHADQFQWQWQGRHKVYYWSLNSDDDVLYMIATVCNNAGSLEHYT